jgi:hypothetical protein
MAIGDDAAAEGMDLVPSTGAAGSPGKVRQGYQEINRTRDYIAQKLAAAKAYADGLFDSISLSWSNITGKPSTFPSTWASVSGKPSQFTPTGHTHSTDDITGLAMPINTIAAGGFTSSVWNRQLTSSYRTAYITNANSAPTELGHTASSERYKKDITPFDITDEQVALLQLVTFRWKTDDGHIEVGLIAERLVEAGLGWAVFYNDDDEPEGIHYERAWLALLPYVQRLAQRITALETQHG